MLNISFEIPNDQDFLEDSYFAPFQAGIEEATYHIRLDFLTYLADL